MNLSTNTKIYAVIGDPITQSLSPKLHNTLFSHYHQDALYLPIAVQSKQLDDFVKGFRILNAGGFNVTKPHKINIMNYLDAIDPFAQKIGAVNTVVSSQEKFIGYNTDGFGFIKSIEKKLGKIPKSSLKLLILGCGGAVKSIAMALAQWGVKKIIIANRTYEKALALVNQMNTLWPEISQAIPMEDDALKEATLKTDLVINGTSLGMADSLDKTPLKKEFITKNLFVYDMIYSPATTRLLADAKAKGAQTANGLEMLLYQGLLAFELWRDIFPDADLGKKILLEGLKNNG